MRACKFTWHPKESLAEFALQHSYKLMEETDAAEVRQSRMVTDDL